MNLKDQLLMEHSRANCDLIVNWIGNSQEKFDQLLNVFLEDNYKITQRASWPLCTAAIEHPVLIKSHLKKILLFLKNDTHHEGVKRNMTKLFQEITIPEEFAGEIMDTCFNNILNPLESVAVKAYSLGILEKFTIDYPEIIPELTLVIRDQMSYQTAAFKSRGKRILAKFNK